MKMDVQPSSIPISIAGRYFWRGDTRFLVRGVAYNVDGIIDPIADNRLSELQHDIVLFRELGLNTIFVESIDNTKDHEKAMALLKEAGIYVFTTISMPHCAINRRAPYDSYNSGIMMSFFRTLDIMAHYPNTLGVAAASQLISSAADLPGAPVLKAIVRDLKRYMRMRNQTNGQRILPICYDHGSSLQYETKLLEFLTDGDEASTIDFWTSSNYSWAGRASMQISGYNHLLRRFKNAKVPMFFSNYGSNNLSPRLFQETKAIYSSEMIQVFSGGCAYEFWEHRSEYGLVELLYPDKKMPGSETYEEALERADDTDKVFEKRETDQGLVLIYHDFQNYKTNLATSKDAELGWDRSVIESEAAEKVHSMQTQADWPWEPDHRVPESCVDWIKLEGAMKDGDGSLADMMKRL